MNFESVPLELRQRLQWVCSALPSKRPVQPNGKAAKVNDSSTWCAFDDCYQAARRRNWAVAFIFTPNDPYAVIDLDHVRGATTGETEPWALAVLDELCSYSEVSMSGTGWHIIVRGNLPSKGNKAGRVEMYDRAKAMTLTGNTIPFCGDEDIREVNLNDLHARLHTLDPKYTRKPSAPRKDKQPVAAGHKSASEGDFAKIGLIYRIIGRVKDADEIEREFMRRFPTEYRTRNDEKRNRACENYIRYSIQNFLRRIEQ